MGKSRRMMLNNGDICLVDAKDFNWLNQYKWRLREKDGYVMRKVKSKGVVKEVTIHSLIAEKHYGKRPDGKVVDHINGNKLDNTPENLRYCSRKENSQNCKMHHTNNTGFKGVRYRGDNMLYDVRIAGFWIGYFKNPVAGANAYNYFSERIFGDFSRPNDVPYMPREEWEKHCRSKRSDKWEEFISEHNKSST